MDANPPQSKVFYRPIEAAIRWAGLLRHKQAILSAIASPQQLPATFDCPRWNELRLCHERIYDALLNRELPYGLNGVTLGDESLLDCPDLTVRHVDIKRWMQTNYPEHRPAFLFSHSERCVHPVVSLEVGQALLTERQLIKLELEHSYRQRQELHDLQESHELLRQRFMAVSAASTCPEYVITDRAEATYLHIIGAMLELMLGQSPAGKPHSCFQTQEAIVCALVTCYGGTMGITERTLHGKFASARRRLNSTQG